MSIPTVAAGSQEASQWDHRERRVQQEQNERGEQTATTDGAQRSDVAVDITDSS